MSIEEIKELLSLKRETPNLDFKEDLLWNHDNREKCLGIIKDILAMVNVQDGGRILFGVRDGDYELVGMSKESWDSFDITKISQLLNNFAAPIFTCALIKKVIDGKRIVIIEVPEFNEIPIVCKDSAFTTTNKEILRKGAIYIRTTKCTSEAVSSAEEMRSILGRGIVKKGDELVSSIQKIISGKPLISSPSTNKAYKEEIVDAKQFIDGVINKDYGYWEVIAYPSIYEAKRINSQSEASELISKCQVKLRGWYFPHLDESGNATNFNKGKQSYTASERHFEALRLYKSGLFVWKEYLWEDARGFKSDSGAPALGYESAMFSITEHMLFFKRLFGEELPDIDAVHIEIKIGKCMDRMLEPQSPGVMLHDSPSKEDTIVVEDDIKIVDLKGSAEEVARRFIKEVFLLFNCDFVSDAVIEEWQKKFIERRI